MPMKKILEKIPIRKNIFTRIRKISLYKLPTDKI